MKRTVIQKGQGGYAIQEPGEVLQMSANPSTIARKAIKLTENEIAETLKTLVVGEDLVIETQMGVGGDPNWQDKVELKVNSD